MVKRLRSRPLQFSCLLCRHTFTFNVPLPNYEAQAKRVPFMQKARMVADYYIKLHRMGGRGPIRVREIVEEYGVARSTFYRAKRLFETERLVFVWRLNYEEMEFLRREVEERGRLRQGWGWVDIREGFEAFRRAWEEAAERFGWDAPSEKEVRRRFNVLKVMVVAKAGDVVIVPKYAGPHTFMVARVSRGYGFEMTEKGDYGHYIGVENLRIFSSAFEDLDEVEDLSDEYIEAVQSMNEFLRTVRSLHYAVSVIGPDMGYVRDVVERVLSL